jgi:hypothetical protein
MRNQAETVQDSATGLIPCAAWRVTEAVALPGFRVSVRFVDGTSGEIDLSRLVLSDEAGVFAALRDPSVFAGVYVENGAVTWPGEIDLAPDAMYDEIKKSGSWVPE